MGKLELVCIILYNILDQKNIKNTIMKMGKYKKEINDINRLSLKRKYT